MTGTTRSLARLAVRNGRRNPGRSLLIVALLAVPIATAVVVAAGQRALVASPAEQAGWYYGRSEAVVRASIGVPFGPEAALLDADEVAAATGVTPGQAVELVDWAQQTDPGFLALLLAEVAPGAEVAAVARTYTTLGQTGFEILGMDPTAPVTDGIVSRSQGAWPVAADQVSLTPATARRLGVGPGDTVAIEPLGTVQVTGLHRLRAEADALGVVALPEALPAGSQTDYLIADLPDRFDVHGEVQAALVEAFGPGVAGALATTGWIHGGPTDSLVGYTDAAPLRIDRPPVLAGFVAAALLLEVGLIASAAHATGARRRLRELGLLATVGAEPSHIRRLVLIEAAVLGVASVALGGVTGIVATRLLAGPISRLPVHLVDRVSVGWGDLVAPSVVGLAAALLAAWWPARTVARVPVLSALAGRMPVRPLTARAVPRALALLAIGLGALAAGATTARYDRSLSDAAVVVMLGGCLLCLAGAALGGTWFVGRVAARADRLPLVLRLVARDAGRQQFRSAVAVAGLVVVLAAPIAVAAVAVTAEADSRSKFVPVALDDEILLSVPLVPGEEPASAPDDLLRAVAAAAPGRVAGTYQLLGVETTYGDGTTSIESAWVSGHPFGSVALGTPAAVRALRLGDEASEILDGGDLAAVSGGVGPVTLQLPAADGVPVEIPMTSEAAGARAPSHGAPGYLLPPALADELGLVPLQSTTVFVAERTISEAQRDAVWGIGTEPGTDIGEVSFTVGQRFDPFSARVQTVALPAALAVVLVVGGSLVAIAATESDRHIATMRRVGAAPSLRRRFLALQGWYHGVLAAALAVPVGLLMLVALRQAVIDPPPLVIPWTSVAVVVVAIPALLGMVIGLAVRSTPPGSLRPGIER